MNEKKQTRHVVDILFILVLFLLFTTSALAVVLIGANVYKNTTTNMDENFTARTSVNYIAEKIRQNDVDGGITVEAITDGTTTVTALSLAQTYNNKVYCTYIYAYEGSLMELFLPQSDSTLLLASGQKILDVTDFSIEDMGDHLFHIQVTASDGATSQLAVAGRSRHE